MQLILLTHDEMVQSAFRKGADLPGEDDNENTERHSHDYICGRLFSHRYAKRMFEESDEKELQRPFYNLYLPN